MSTEEQQVLRVEPDVDVAQVLQRAQEETGADSSTSEIATCTTSSDLPSVLRDPMTLRPVSLSAELRFMPVPRSAGAMPNKMPVTR